MLGILSFVPIFFAPQAGQTIEQWARRETFATLIAVSLPVLWLILRMPNQGPRGVADVLSIKLNELRGLYDSAALDDIVRRDFEAARDASTHDHRSAGHS